MGVVLLGTRNVNNLSGVLSSISGELHVKDESYIWGTLSGISGSLQEYTRANLEGDVAILDGYLWSRNGGSLEGELKLLDTPPLGAFIGTSNCIALEGELVLPECVLYGGGNLSGELSLLEDSRFIGTVPVVGSIVLTGPTISGSFYAGGAMALESVTLAGSMGASVPSVGRINGLSTLRTLAGCITGSVPITSSLIGSLATLTGNLVGRPDISCSLTGPLVNLSGNMIGLTNINGILEGDLSILSGHMSGVYNVLGTLVGDLALLRPQKGFKDAAVYDYGVLRFVRGETR